MRMHTAQHSTLGFRARLPLIEWLILSWFLSLDSTTQIYSPSSDSSSSSSLVDRVIKAGRANVQGNIAHEVVGAGHLLHLEATSLAPPSLSLSLASRLLL